MKILQVVPKPGADAKLKTLLDAKERELRGSRTTFFRKKAGKWGHKRYAGWINWSETTGGLLVAEIHGRGETTDWQLMQAFVGYLDRHLSDAIDSITIFYR